MPKTLPIYTSLNIPTVTAHPSPNCLQWSGDGQICFVTKTAAYIMAPDHGINFDNDSVIKSGPHKDISGEAQLLGWFRTIIQLDKSVAKKWPEHSQEWGVVSLGSIDVTLCDIAFSPSGLSPNAGCLLATLSSNMDLTIWTPGKNYLKGEWSNICDVTAFLLTTQTANDDTSNMTAQALKSQVTCVTWTPQAEFELLPAPSINSSILITGSRAGTLTFIRYKQDKSLHHIGTLSVSDKWITHAAFSHWSPIGNGTSEGLLAYATSDGALGVVKIIQTLTVIQSTCGLAPDFDISVTFEIQDLNSLSTNKAGVTGLGWAIVPDRDPILVHCKPGVVYLWSANTQESVWSGARGFLLETQKNSSASSALNPVSGICYIPGNDLLVLTLHDGSFHTLHHLSSNPSWLPSDGNGGLTSHSLSQVARSVFVATEQNRVNSRDVNRITGLTLYDGASNFLWIQESSRPSDFSYKHDAKNNSMVISAKIWEDPLEDEKTLKELVQVLHCSRAASGLSPLYLLRPILFRLRNQVKLNALLPRLLEQLQPSSEDHSRSIKLSTIDTDLCPELRQEFRHSITAHLFGWDDLLSLRMRLSLSDFAWKLSDNEQKRMKCGLVAQDVLNKISHRVLRTMIRHVTALVKVLKPSDMPFISRLVVQSTLPGSPDDLSQEGQNLLFLMQTINSEDISHNLNEVCPACEVEIPLQDITIATCSNGHIWARCSITTFILSTPSVRTCVGCSRKAFLSSNLMPQNGLPTVAQGWIVEELLEAVRRCLFCGNGFVSVL